MTSHPVHVHEDAHHDPLQTFCHDVGRALGATLGQYLRAYRTTRPHDEPQDHDMDEHIPSDHVDDHDIDHEVHHGDIPGVSHDHEDVHEAPHDHMHVDDYGGSYACSRLPLVPVARALLFDIDDHDEPTGTEANAMPLDPEPPVVNIGPSCDDHHEHEGFDPLSPGIPRARRSPRVTRSRAHVRSAELRQNDIVMVPSRFGEFPLARRLADSLKEFHASHWCVPSHIPVEEKVKVWGRKWIVKQSSLHPSVGLGLFACEDILLPSFPTEKDKETLFPYCGMVYPMGTWNALSHASNSFRVFGLSADSYPDLETGRRVARPDDGSYRMIDGDPVRCSNIAAYINSVSIPRALKGSIRRMVPNVEFVFEDGPPPGAPTPPPRAPPEPPQYDFHILVCATRSIRKGDELLARYDMPKKM